MSASWNTALTDAPAAFRAGCVVAAVGEPGSGRATLLGQALRRAHSRIRVLSADVPAAADVEAWLSLWLTKPATAVVVENVDALPAWAAEELRRRAVSAVGTRTATPGGGQRLSWAVTASTLDAVPPPLGAPVDTVVAAASLRERTDDVLPLARWAAHQTRMREVGFTPAAERAIAAYGWPGNAHELVRVVHDAATRGDPIDVRHLPPPSVAVPHVHQLTRLEGVERDEIVRVLADPTLSVSTAAVMLGMGRATLYRTLRHYGITRPA